MLSRFSVKAAFVFALFPLLFFSTWPLVFFAPYLIVTFYNRRRTTCIWHALLCGVILDLLSPTPIFGITALTYAITTYFLYPQIRNFFEDKLSTLPLMTALFVFLSTLFSIAAYFLFGYPQRINLQWVATDLILMPLVDALYSLIWFALPFQFYFQASKLIRRRRAHATFRNRAR